METIAVFLSDQYGNIWYGSSNLFDDLGNEINQPFFMVSTDGGQTYTLAYTLPAPSTNFLYDYPQYCFGGDGSGNYGLQFTTDLGNTSTGDLGPVVGFIPITGLGAYGTPTPTNLASFVNLNQTPTITASNDGRVWYYGYSAGFGPGLLPTPASGITSVRVIYKSPGPIDQNYAGPWDFSIGNFLSDSISLPTDDAQPVTGFFNTIQSILYDDKRQALYCTTSNHYPDFSQNMKLYFSISRDNGQTWSEAIEISNSDFGNRGFASMALDYTTGDLYFGWYDGRHDPTFKSVKYYGAVILARELNEMVKSIPLSNPIYTLSSATVSATIPLTTASTVSTSSNSALQIRKKHPNRRGRVLKGQISSK